MFYGSTPTLRAALPSSLWSLHAVSMASTPSSTSTRSCVLCPTGPKNAISSSHPNTGVRLSRQRGHRAAPAHDHRGHVAATRVEATRMAAPAGCVALRPVVLGRCAACARPWPSRPDAAPERAARGRGQNGGRLALDWHSTLRLSMTKQPQRGFPDGRCLCRPIQLIPCSNCAT